MNEAEFWSLYLECHETMFSDEEMNTKLAALVARNFEEVKYLSNHEMNWPHVIGWLAVRSRQMYTKQNESLYPISVGDVLLPHPITRQLMVVTFAPVLMNVELKDLMKRRDEIAYDDMFIPLFNPQTVAPLVLRQVNYYQEKIADLLRKSRRLWKAQLVGV
ncbi:MAG: hypothetical protein V4686_00970 [Patescibacteria group bacterium]